MEKKTTTAVGKPPGKRNSNKYIDVQVEKVAVAWEERRTIPVLRILNGRIEPASDG